MRNKFIGLETGGGMVNGSVYIISRVKGGEGGGA